VNNFLETLKQLGPSRLGIMGAILLGLLIFFVFVSLRVSTPEMRLLYADLPADGFLMRHEYVESPQSSKMHDVRAPRRIYQQWACQK